MTDTIEEIRKCSTCEVKKPLTDFNGGNKCCKKCLEKQKEYYDKNREEILEVRKQYREQNRDNILEQKKQYRERCKEQIQQARKLDYEQNKDTILEKQRERFKAKIECPVCKTDFLAHMKSRHEDTNKHKKQLNKENETEQWMDCEYYVIIRFSIIIFVTLLKV